jgi:hypothetical protein
VRPSDCPNPPCFHLHPVPPPTPTWYHACHPTWHLRLPQRGEILRMRYAASRTTDCSCRRTQSPAPRPPPPSSMRVLGECSGASVLRHAQARWPGEGASLARPRPGIGTTGCCQATPPSSATG